MCDLEKKEQQQRILKVKGIPRVIVKRCSNMTAAQPAEMTNPDGSGRMVGSRTSISRKKRETDRLLNFFFFLLYCREFYSSA